MDAKPNKEKEVRRRQNISAEIVHETILCEGEIELKRSTPALIWSALAAGLSMGFSFLMEAALLSMLPPAEWTPLLSKLGYSAGFIIVILGRQQLFTENTLTPILPLLESFSRKNILNVLRLWGVVLIFNTAGGALFSLLLAGTPAFDAGMHAAFTEIGKHLVELDPLTMFVRGIFAGWLIALIVWLLPSAEHVKLWIIILLTYLIGIGGFPHIIASAAEVFYLCMTGQWPWGRFLLDFFLPVLAGNILGGVTLVTALNHAQVSADQGK